ncbi:MAG: methyltransferase family protein [Thermoplasmatota archaeon]
MRFLTGDAAAGRWALRVLMIIILASPFVMPHAFMDHFRAHFTGGIEGSMITGQWHVVLINIVLFLSFLVPLSFRKKISWKEFGLVTAFFVSLFVEMYGIPLTVMFASRAFNTSTGASVDPVMTIRLLGVDFGFTAPMIYGTLLMALGTIIVVIGWVTLYRNIDRDGLVTSGIYSVSRHPQYLGFLLVIYGWIIGWTTVLTVIFGLILFLVYIRVCFREEKEMDLDHDYGSYKEKVPFMI